MRSIWGIVLCLIFLSCAQEERHVYDIQKTAFGSSGMVVAGHPLATEAGIQILNAGGNAVDAAIAVQYALAVVHPRAGNIGGGGFLVFRPDTGDAMTLDFREKAPIAATRNMYLDSLGNPIPELSRIGHLASGVPGTVAGMAEAYDKFGSRPWSSLLTPAIRYARDGVRLTRNEADRLNTYRKEFLEFNPSDIPFIKEVPWKAGDLFIQEELARTLERIARDGSAGFYSGETADYIMAEMQEGGGMITMDDLQRYRAVWRPPVTTEYKDFKLISMPPPSSGGIALAQLLEMVEPYPIGEWGGRDVRTIHLMAEAERRAFADRAEYLGDRDFYPVPVDTLLDPEYLRARMTDFDSRAATNSSSIHAGDFPILLESYETTHFTTIDSTGNAVSLTTTLNLNYGSKVYVEGAGFLLNSEMDDFSVKPGFPNYFGLIGAEANAIQSEKRMLSSMTPTIVEKDDTLYMTLGAPGGSTIITSVFQVFLNVAEFGMSVSEAVVEKRFHHQWLPDEIIHEPGAFGDSTLTLLEEKGHQLREVETIGAVQALHALGNGQIEGAADPRRDAHAKAQ